MHTGRFRRITGLTGAILCLFAATSYAQDTTVTTPPTTVPEVRTGTAGGPPFDTTAMESPLGVVDTLTAEGEGDDGDFPWGLLGLLGLLGLFKRGGTTVVTRDAYTSPPSGTRPGSPRTPPDDRTMNLNPRPGEGSDPRR